VETAAERFGEAIGGVGFRVLVTVAGAKLAKGLPEVPKGGIWVSLSPPRFAFMGGGARGGFSVRVGTRAQVNVANGTVMLMGVSANTAAAAVASAVASARTAGACREGEPELVGKYENVRGLKVDPARMGDVSICRPWGWTGAIIITERIKLAMERAGITGLRLREA
jgi:hypothetical protein